jgi:hypothetical protein
MIELQWNVPFITGHNSDIGNHWTIDMRNAGYCPSQINSHNKTNFNKGNAYPEQFQTLNEHCCIFECVSAILYNKNLRIESRKCEGRNCNVVQKSSL